MASGKSLELAAIPTRKREWVHKHEVKDIVGPQGTMIPGPATRRERRAVGKWFGPSTTPYVKG